MLVPEVVAHVLAAPARLRTSRLVCVDGRAGAGKSTYAAELAASCRAATSSPVAVLHMDDMYEGWTGLPGVAEVVSSMLMDPWSRGLQARPAHWDWATRRRVAPRPVPLLPVVILEGVGSYARRHDHLVTTLIWLECPAPIRRRRALARDGAVFAPHWQQWARDEDRVHAREDTRARVDLTVDTAVAPVPASAVVGPTRP